MKTFFAENSSSRIEKWHLDVSSMDIYNDRGEKFDLKDAKNVSPYKTNKYAKKTIDKTDRLKIQLGLNCNYSCSYCSQKRNNERVTDKIAHRSVDEFLKKLDKCDFKNLKSIEFWGGEPLVYWKILKPLAIELRKRFPDVYFQMITNGSLLTKDIVDFLKATKICICVSHDAQGQSERGKDPIQDNYQNLLYAKQELQELGFNFHLVVTKKNCDLEESKSFFKQKFGEDTKMSIEGIVETNDISILPDEKGRQKLYESIRAMLSASDGESPYDDDAIKLLRILTKEGWSPNGKIKCGILKENVLSIDMNGNILKCHGTSAQLGTVGNISDIQNVQDIDVIYWEEKGCGDCRALPLCMGGCPLTTKFVHEYCMAKQTEFDAIFSVLFESITGLRFIGFEKEKSHRRKVIGIVPSKQQ